MAAAKIIYSLLEKCKKTRIKLGIAVFAGPPLITMMLGFGHAVDGHLKSK